MKISRIKKISSVSLFLFLALSFLTVWKFPTVNANDTLEIGANYIIYQVVSTVYVYNVSSNSIVFNSTNVELAFATAFGYLSAGQKLVIRPATYTLASQLTMSTRTMVTVAFESGAVLTIANNLNVAVLTLSYCVNCTLLYPQINGNAANQLQSASAVSNGINFDDCSGCLINGATIVNVARDGLEIDVDVTNLLPNGIKNSLITFCGWNGITLGGGNPDAIGEYAINNTVAYCSDVGISSYGVGDRIIGNYVHDMNGTTNTQARWGLAVEGNGYALFYNNTVVRCTQGIDLGPTSSLVVNNNFTTDVEAIVDVGTYDTITRNKITDWGTGNIPQASGWAFGIYLESSQNTIVAFNTLKSSNTTLAQAIYCYGATNSAIFNNTITTLTSASSYGIDADSGASGNIAKWNNIQAAYGIEIVGSACTNNTLIGNNLNNCTTQITDTGTRTRINPTSSATYTLTINNDFYNIAISPSSGRYSYSNTTMVTITVTPPQGYYAILLNVDGVNVTLSSNSYSLSMNKDHFACMLATVNSAPSVTILPTSVALDVGQSQNFSSSTSDGTSPYSYQWYLDGSAVSGATGASWNYTPSSAGSHTVYVKVTDAVDFVAMSNTVPATVNAALSVGISPTSVTMDVGQSVTFTPSVSGGMAPYSYQWYLNGSSVSGATGPSWTYTPTSSSLGSHSVYVKVTDNASTPVTAQSNTASVTVNAALSVIVSPSSVTMDVSQSVTFNSTVSGGTSPFSYQWYLNGTAVLGATSSDWTFTRISSGSYTVYLNVTDSAGVSAISLASNVTVSPTIPEFQPLFFLALFMMATLLAAFVLRRKRKVRT